MLSTSLNKTFSFLPSWLAKGELSHCCFEHLLPGNDEVQLCRPCRLHRACGERMVVEMMDNSWFQDMSHVLITCKIALNGDQVQLTAM